MTAIVSFSVRKRPVLLGDLLLSGDERDPDLVRVPSIGPVTNVFPRGSGYTITGLKQKLAVLHPDVAMAWAGSYIGARSVADELKTLVSQREVTPDYISGFLEDVEKDNTLGNLSLIVLVTDRTSRIVHTIPVRVWFYQSDHYGGVYVGGTGHQDIVSILKNIERSELATLPRDFNHASLAISYGLRPIDWRENLRI
jgi:hypothetical protein